jgi:hypothetical protein
MVGVPRVGWEADCYGRVQGGRPQGCNRKSGPTTSHAYWAAGRINPNLDNRMVAVLRNHPKLLVERLVASAQPSPSKFHSPSEEVVDCFAT